MSRKYRRAFLTRLFGSGRRDLDDEFQFHILMRAGELERAGMSSDDARAQAEREFGDVDDARTYCLDEDRKRFRAARRATWLDDLRQDVTLAARILWRDPAFTFTTVIVLAVAIAIATSAYGIAHAYLVRPLPYPEPDRLAQIIAGPSRGQFPNAPSLQRVQWQPVESVFDATVSWDLDAFTLAGAERPEFVDGAWVTAGYFSALGMRPAIGRGFTSEEYAAGGPRVAIISHALWRRRYNGDPAVIGQKIRAHSTDRPNENEVVTIVGIMAADSWHVSRFTDVLRPLTEPRMPYLAKLPPGMSIAQAEQQLNAIVLPQLGAIDPAWKMTLVSMQDEYTEGVRPILIALLGAGAFLLLIGGASVAGAQVARAASRRTEIQVRAALGASRGRIVRQLIAENLVLAAAAALIGVMLANLTLGAAGAFVGDQLRVGVPGGADRLAPDGFVLALAVLTGTAIGVAFGVVPALLSARVDAAAAIRDAAKGTSRASTPARLRRVLIAAQVAFTMTLLVGAGLMTRTVVAIANVPLGFDEGNVIKGWLLLPLGRYPDAASRRQGADKLLAALEATPGVRGAALASPYPFRGQMPFVPITAEGQSPLADAGPRAVQYVVSPRFFDVMAVRVLTGRAFDRTETAESPPVAIVSEELARRLWRSNDALGQRLRIGTDTVWRTVIGVTRDTREVVSADQHPDVYLPYAHVPRAFVGVLTRTDGAPEGMLPVLPKVVAGVDDVFALGEVETMTTVVGRDGQRHRALAIVLGVFASFALGLAVLGLYSALAYVVAQRRREIAIRSAVGADARRIARLVLGEGIPLVVGGLIAGTGLSFALTRALRSQLYGVTANDATTFVAIAAVIALAGFVALLIPMRQALRVDPAVVLRAE